MAHTDKISDEEPILVDFDKEQQEAVHSSYFLSNSNWVISGDEGSTLIIKAMYFALTSLSTVGFGDFYPITDFERLLTSFVLLIGIMLFSYVLSELRFMMKRIKVMDSEIENIE